MGTKIDEMLVEFRKTTDRLNQIEKNVLDLANSRSEAVNVVRKALVSGRGDASIGFDGAEAVPFRMGRRTKSLGCGEFLRGVAVACGAVRPEEIGWQGGPIDKAMERMGSRPVQKTALAEGSGALGGYTVPPQFISDLMKLTGEESFAKQLCTVLPMSSRSAMIPALDHSATPAAGASAFFGGVALSWQPEAASINQTNPTFRQIELVARDLVAHTVASNQLLMDNAVALDSVITTLFKDAMAWAYDYYVLRGTGTNQPLGCLNSPAAVVVDRNTNTTFRLVDAATMMSNLLTSSWTRAIWVMHPSVIPQLVQMTNAATNSPTLVWLNPAPNSLEGPAALQFPATFFGRPIHFTEKVPSLGTKGDVMLLDLSYYLLGDRMQIQIETSKDARFLTNELVWRVIARWDGQPWLNDSITLADGAHSVSPIVVLDT